MVYFWLGVSEYNKMEVVPDHNRGSSEEVVVEALDTFQRELQVLMVGTCQLAVVVEDRSVVAVETYSHLRWLDLPIPPRTIKNINYQFQPIYVLIA